MNDVKTAIKQFWNDNPQTYADTHGVATYNGEAHIMGSAAFFEHLDSEFFRWNFPLHSKRPFDRIFPFDRFGPGKKILEIGCGMGTMAMLWAQNGNDITALDLNEEAVKRTQQRFALYNLKGRIGTGDGNHLQFPDHTFDYVYSWGVLHHSPDLDRSLQEMMRVLKPGGEFGVMLYHRRSFLHGYWTHFIEGFLHYEHRFLGPLELASRYGDGYAQEGNPHTWPVTRAELSELLESQCRQFNIKTFGTELDSIFKLMLPGIGLVIPQSIKKCWARRFGWSLWAYGTKK